VVQPYHPAPVAVAKTPIIRPAVPVATYAYVRPATVPVTQPSYAYARPATVPAVQQSYASVAPAPGVIAGRPVARTWVMDAQPYRYTPAPHPVAPPVSYVAAQ
jgi:hypothetical protein